MTLKNNRAPLLSIIKLNASFHHHAWIQTRVTVRKRLSWVFTSVTLTFDLWPWPFAWASLLSLVITPENFMMIRWWEHGEKGVTDGRTDRQTDGQTENTICRAAWSQLKMQSIYVLYEHGNSDMFPKYRLSYNIQNCLTMGWRFLSCFLWLCRRNTNLYSMISFDFTFYYAEILLSFSSLLNRYIIIVSDLENRVLGLLLREITFKTGMCKRITVR